MKKLLLIQILFSVVLFVHGQGKRLNVSNIFIQHDSLGLIKELQDDSTMIGLPNLAKSKDSLHFRFSTPKQSVDIWTNDYKVFHGVLTSFIDGYRRSASKNSVRELFYGYKTIDTIQSKDFFLLFQSLKVFSIPSCDSITGWGIGMDGIGYIMEYSTPNSYSYKYYWSPYSMKEVKEAIIIDSVINSLTRELKMQETFNEFIRCLPAGRYYVGGMRIQTYSGHGKGKKGAYKKKPDPLDYK